MKLMNPEKVEFATELLKKNIPFTVIRTKLTEKFGSAMSNSALSNLRNNIVHGDVDPADCFLAVKQFWGFYNSLLQVTSQKGVIQEADLSSLISSNLDLYLLEKIRSEMKIMEIIEHMPPEIQKKAELVENIKLSLRDINDGRVMTLEEYKKCKKSKINEASN